jgi:hypothetical protein
MMSGFVEEVAKSNDSSRLTGEVQSERRGIARKSAGYGVQFLTATVQVIFGQHEIGCAESCATRKEDSILAVPKSMAGGF